LLRIVDRLIVIDQGVVLADGPRDEIIGHLQRGAGQ
jgi:ATP-binding cassette subfamily C protein LapB